MSRPEASPAPRPELSRPLGLEELRRRGSCRRRIEASAEECATVAARLDLPRLDRLEGELEATWPSPKRPIRVEGRIRAEGAQACVVTLEPVAFALDEAVELRFLAHRSQRGTPAGEPLEIDPLGEDPPELVEGETLDLGECLVTELALDLDPYPRRPGARVPGGEEDEAGADTNPFLTLVRERDPDPS